MTQEQNRCDARCRTLGFESLEERTLLSAGLGDAELPAASPVVMDPEFFTDQEYLSRVNIDDIGGGASFTHATRVAPRIIRDSSGAFFSFTTTTIFTAWETPYNDDSQPGAISYGWNLYNSWSLFAQAAPPENGHPAAFVVAGGWTNFWSSTGSDTANFTQGFFGAGFSGGGSVVTDIPGETRSDLEALIDLVTPVIDPDFGDAFGGNGMITDFDPTLNLVVGQADAIHDDVLGVLGDLRQQQDLQVTVEVRLLSVSDNFFERIGIDFDFDVDDNVPVGRFNPQSDSRIGTAYLSDIETFFFLQATQDEMRDNVQRVPKVTLFNAHQANIETTIIRPGHAVQNKTESFTALDVAANADQHGNLPFAPQITLSHGQIAIMQTTVEHPNIIGLHSDTESFSVEFQPIVEVESEGVILIVEAVVSADRRETRMTVVPTLSNVDVFTSSFINSGTGSNTDELLLMVTPRITIQED